ncbi:rust resistance kinase Lr10-like, partial [Hevea brasiliensis]|uniref:rust resistance kinase Lr10-like n=1 Tax=Hevea brasiliensis TaxID=3981 RepID=UPI0025F1139D
TQRHTHELHVIEDRGNTKLINSEANANVLSYICELHSQVKRRIITKYHQVVCDFIAIYKSKRGFRTFISSADTKNHFLGWKRLQDIALGIAKGIEYLHQGCDQRILHFDIKPHNILLDHDFNPKISDFGLAKFCAKDQSAVSMTTARVTIGYIAPEVFSRNFGTVSYKSDVYSFGMLVLEMVGGRKIVDVAEGNDEQIYFPEWIYDLLEEGEDLRFEIEEEGDTKIAKKLAIVGLWCIQWNPADRPSMKVAVHMLEGQGENLPTPPILLALQFQQKQRQEYQGDDFSKSWRLSQKQSKIIN